MLACVNLIMFIPVPAMSIAVVFKLDFISITGCSGSVDFWVGSLSWVICSLRGKVDLSHLGLFCCQINYKGIYLPLVKTVVLVLRLFLLQDNSSLLVCMFKGLLVQTNLFYLKDTYKIPKYRFIHF